MALLPEWDMFGQGVASGIVGLVVLLIDVIVWCRLEGKEPIKVSGKTVVSVIVGVLGALLFGVGMCLSMVLDKMILGIVIGFVGIFILLMLIPITKGIRD